MEMLQYILVSIIGLIAIGWVIKKYFLPAKNGTGCGDGDCGCH